MEWKLNDNDEESTPLAHSTPIRNHIINNVENSIQEEDDFDHSRTITLDDEVIIEYRLNCSYVKKKCRVFI